MSVEDRLAYWQRRARLAEREVEFERKQNEHTNRWAQEAFAEQRRLTDRLVHVIQVAMSRGVPIEAFNQETS